MEGEDQEISFMSSSSQTAVSEDVKEELKPPNFTNIPDALKIILKRTTQNRLLLVADDDVTADKPLKVISKKDLINDINEHITDSEFLPILQNIKRYPGDEILFVYLPNSKITEFEYYMVTTIETKDKLLEQFKNYEDLLRKELMKSVIKNVGCWTSLGSENEVNQLNEDQRYRALFEIEIESKFPLISENIKFSNRNVDDAIDGYVEITPYRQTFNNIERLRVDCPVQASLPKNDMAIQTILTFPTNAWTQYQYEFTPPVEVPVIVKKGQPKPKTALERFLNPDFLAPIYHQLTYNWEVNLYRNDYPKLRVDTDKLVFVERFEEIMSFVDVEKCTGKLIGSCNWSHTYTGMFLATYVDYTPNSIMDTRPTRDEIYRAIYGINPVLIWSSQNSLRPLLELESPREVTQAAFCCYDENLVAGGCVNGQIIVWDLKGRLQEKSAEILTPAQEKYRTIMQRMTTWFKNVKNPKLVLPACVSNLQYGHKGPISAIHWLPPQYRMARHGKVEIVQKPDVNPSYQFITTGYDGIISFWDLKYIPPEAENKKGANISKRLGKRLSELNIDVSPFNILNHVLRPIYQLFVSTDNICNASITSISLNCPTMSYENVTNPNNITKNFTTCHKYKLRLPENVPPFPQEVLCSFVRGDVAKVTWEGFEVDSGAPVNIEKAQVQLFKKVHDGPIISVLRSPFFDDICLTIGGHFFALWETNFPEHPLIFRQRDYQITTCSWSPCRPGCFHLGFENGTLEVWDLTNKLDETTFTQSISGKALTFAEIHRLPLQTQVIGVADYRGTFRILEIPTPLSMHSETHKGDLKSILEQSKKRKLQFLNWERDWKQRHETDLVEYKQKLHQSSEEKRKTLEEEIARAKKIREKEIEEMRKQALLESKPQPGKYEEWAQKKFEKMQSAQMRNVLFKKKGFKREDLVEFLAPLTRINEQKEKKAKKGAKLLEMKEKIYEDTIDTTFQAAKELKLVSDVEEKIENLRFPNEQEYYQNFLKIQDDVLKKLKSFEYKAPFDWNETIERGLERRKTIDIGLMINIKHRERLRIEDDLSEHPPEGELIKQPSAGVMIKPPSENFPAASEILIKKD